MQRTSALLLLCVGLVSGARAAAREAPPPREVGFGGEERVEVVEGWPFLVKGSCGSLGPADLRVFEDGVAARVLALGPPERTTRHVLLLDTSASMSHQGSEFHRRRGEQVKSAARAYVDWMYQDVQRESAGASTGGGAAEPVGELMLLTFDDDLVLHAPSTPVRTAEDVLSLHRVIDAIGGGERTFLNDALWQLVSYLAGYPERSVVILVSDGEDTGGEHPEDDVLRLVNGANNVTVFTIGIGQLGPEHEAFLRRVADASGGRHMTVRDKKPAKLGTELTGRFGEIKERLQNEFHASWFPPQAPADQSQVAVRIESVLERCNVEQTGYRRQRFTGLDPRSVKDAGPASGPGSARLADDRVSVPVVDVIRDDDPLRMGWAQKAHRDVQLLVPAFDLHRRVTDSAPSAIRPAPEEVIRHWMLARALPHPRTSQDRYSPPLVHEMSGAALLAERYSLARAVYDHFEPYRLWAREKLAASFRDELLRKLALGDTTGRDGPEDRAAQVEAIVALRLEAPRPEELARELLAWHRDLPAREIAIGVERLQADRLLAGAASALAESRTIQDAWQRLYDWLRPPGRVRITTPLMLTYDADRDVFGLCRIALPRRGSWPADSVPPQPYALQLVRFMLGLDPFSGETATEAASSDTPLARAVRGLALESLHYAAEPLIPEGEPDRETPLLVEHNRFRLGLRAPGATETITLEVVADTTYRIPAGWDGRDPVSWTQARGPLEPERLIPRCFVPAAGRPASPIENALAASGVPACP